MVLCEHCKYYKSGAARDKFVQRLSRKYDYIEAFFSSNVRIDILDSNLDHYSLCTFWYTY